LYGASLDSIHPNLKCLSLPPVNVCDASKTESHFKLSMIAHSLRAAGSKPGESKGQKIFLQKLPFLAFKLKKEDFEERLCMC